MFLLLPLILLAPGLSWRLVPKEDPGGTQEDPKEHRKTQEGFRRSQGDPGRARGAKESQKELRGARNNSPASLNMQMCRNMCKFHCSNASKLPITLYDSGTQLPAHWTNVPLTS